MTRALAILAVLAGLAVSPTEAAIRTIVLDVENMYCAACPYIVRGSLAAVPGVTLVEVSFEDKTATVTFDDVVTDVSALTQATSQAGYPSTPRQ